MSTRIQSEKQTVEKMVILYCKGHHHGEAPCGACRELIDYAHQRLAQCRLGESKPFCSKCIIHCYQPEMRERIKTVMRYSGPRMLLHEPITALRHLCEQLGRQG